MQQEYVIVYAKNKICPFPIYVTEEMFKHMRDNVYATFVWPCIRKVIWDKFSQVKLNP